jgi:hypothetical protein
MRREIIRPTRTCNAGDKVYIVPFMTVSELFFEEYTSLRGMFIRHKAKSRAELQLRALPSMAVKVASSSPWFSKRCHQAVVGPAGYLSSASESRGEGMRNQVRPRGGDETHENSHFVYCAVQVAKPFWRLQVARAKGSSPASSESSSCMVYQTQTL